MTETGVKTKVSGSRTGIPTHVITEVAQVRAIRTAVRKQVLDAAIKLQPCSVADVAHETGRLASSLYYHIDALAKVGLLTEVGSRHTGRREEALYEAIAPQVELDTESRESDFLAAIREAYRATLGVAQRRLNHALEQERVGRGPRRNTMVLQEEVRLSKSDLKTLRRMIHDIRDFALARDRQTGGDMVSFTTIMSKTR